MFRDCLLWRLGLCKRLSLLHTSKRVIGIFFKWATSRSRYFQSRTGPEENTPKPFAFSSCWVHLFVLTVNGWSSTLPTAIAALSSNVFTAPVSTWCNFILLSYPMKLYVTWLHPDTAIFLLTQQGRTNTLCRVPYTVPKLGRPLCEVVVCVCMVSGKQHGRRWRRIGRECLPRSRWPSNESKGKESILREVQVSMVAIHE